MVVELVGSVYGEVMGTITLHQDHARRATPCGDVYEGRVCIDVYGHERLGITHIAADGTEWLEPEFDCTYLSDPSHEMALAS